MLLEAAIVQMPQIGRNFLLETLRGGKLIQLFPNIDQHPRLVAGIPLPNLLQRVVNGVRLHDQHRRAQRPPGEPREPGGPRGGRPRPRGKLRPARGGSRLCGDDRDAAEGETLSGTLGDQDASLDGIAGVVGSLSREEGVVEEGGDAEDGFGDCVEGDDAIGQFGGLGEVVAYFEGGLHGGGGSSKEYGGDEEGGTRRS